MKRTLSILLICAAVLWHPVCPVGAVSEENPDWRISSETVFPEGRPANREIEHLLKQLEGPDGPGLPVSRLEFEQLCDRSSPEVYREQLIKYATPFSVQIQKREHADYSRVFMKEERQKAGVAFLRRHRALLNAAERLYGVSPPDIVSILMWESGLGEFVGEFRVFNIFLGQILYLEEGRREAVRALEAAGKYDLSKLEPPAKQRARLDRIKKRAVRNLAVLLRLSKQKGADPTRQLGSWGGAMGYVQFLPASLQFAVDGDEDGEVDLNSWPDAIYSVANYLKEHGYRSTEKSRRKAIYAYNPIDSYVDGVLLYANAISRRQSKGE